ncbi:MAG TPA: phosphopentomutase [Candidatus Krumholzibacteria bacterium]|nr:phosphopentomutase [Candidatus Krumholzibacteria bacterium]HRX50279.1 phosphopentomutase [Candidatus Krumholzibacteria bacterium]
MSHAILIVLDGVGVGALPDADAYGDAGSDTLGHTAAAVGGLNLPNLRRLGLGNIHAIAGVPPAAEPTAAYGRLREISKGKDSTTGHWELMGVVTDIPYPTYPDGFPEEVLAPFRAATGRGVLGNKAASGTAIIQELGDEHVRTGDLIVYTSADSVFQIAAHQDVVPLEELYRFCEIAREQLVPPHGVSRVIARPFVGTSGAYERTPYRRDFSVIPPDDLVLERLRAHGVTVNSIGKIYDLYAGKGIAGSVKSKSNAQGMELLDAAYADDPQAPTLTLLNLVDFDMLYGHRNDPQGMARDLEAFDVWLGGFLARLRRDDLVLITADHGNDPTTPSTDHSREYVPLLAVRGGRVLGRDLGVRDTFADVGATYADYFGAPAPVHGRSFLPLLTPAEGGEA